VAQGPGGGEVSASVQRNASLLWLAQFISAVGDSLFLPCILWMVGDVTGDEAPVGFAVFLATVPHLLFGPMAGTFADRLDRRSLMIVSDVVRAAILIGLPVVVMVLGGVSYPLIITAAFLLAAFSAPFMAARDAFLPELVGGASLVRWNALLQMSQHLALIVGLSAGGLLLAGAPGSGSDRVLNVLQLDGLTFVVSAIALLLIVHPRKRRSESARGGFWREVGEGLAYAKRDRVVGGLLVLTALNNLAIMGPAIVGAVLLIRNVYHLGPQHLAWFEGCMAVGMLIGALWLGRVGRTWPMGKVVLWGMVLDGLTYIPFVWIADYPPALLLITAHGVFIPFIVVGRTSLLQAHVPSERRGKVFALVNLTVLGMTSISALACGWIAQVAGTRTLFGIAGVFGALSGLVGMRWVGKRLAQVPTYRHLP